MDSRLRGNDGSAAGLGFRHSRERGNPVKPGSAIQSNFLPNVPRLYPFRYTPTPPIPSPPL